MKPACCDSAQNVSCILVSTDKIFCNQTYSMGHNWWLLCQTYNFINRNQPSLWGLFLCIGHMHHKINRLFFGLFLAQILHHKIQKPSGKCVKIWSAMKTWNFGLCGYTDIKTVKLDTSFSHYSILRGAFCWRVHTRIWSHNCSVIMKFCVTIIPSLIVVTASVLVTLDI